MLRVGFCLLFGVLLSGIAAQQFSFSQPLTSVFKTIEEHSELKFNYDPKIIAAYNFAGTIDMAEPPVVLLGTLLEGTSLDFELDGNVVLIFSAEKQFYSLCGYLKNKDGGSPVSFANVYTEGTSIGVNSDIDGFFALTVEALEQQVVVISSLGLKAIVMPLSEWPNTGCPSFFMQPETYSIGLDLVVIGYLLKGVSEGADYGSNSFNYTELAKSYFFQEYDVLKTAQLLPGVTSLDESASNLNIRGSLPDQNLVLWEGATLYDPGHVFGLISSINPFVVERVDVFKSAYDPKYENRVGGIVDISLTDQISNELTAGCGTTLTESHAFVHTPIVHDKLSVLFSGRLATSAIAASPTLNNYSEKIFQTRIIGEEAPNTPIGFNNQNKGVAFHDWNAKLLFKPSKRIFLESSVFRSGNEFNYSAIASGDDFESDELVSFKSTAVSTRLQLDWRPQFSTEVLFNKSVYASGNQALFSNNSEFGYSYQTLTTNSINDINAGVIAHLHLADSLEFDLGYTVKRLSVDHNLDFSASTNADFEEMTSSLGNFQNLTAAMTIKKEHISVMTGLRSTYYRELGKWFVSPRVHLQYLLNDHLKLKGAAGQYFQFINQRTNLGNRTINTSSGIWMLGDNESGFVLNTKRVSAGMLFKQNNWLIDIDAYHQKTGGILAVSVPFNQQAEGAGSSHVIGLDVLLKKEWRNYQFWFNYTLSKNRYSFPDLSTANFPANNDHRHNLNLYNDYKWGKWNFSATYHLRGGIPYSTPSSIEEYWPENQQNSFYRLAYDQINSNRLAAYTRLDFGITYRTQAFKKKVSLEFTGSLLNALNRKNISSRDFFLGDMELSEGFKIITIEKFQLKRTPQFLLRMYW